MARPTVRSLGGAFPVRWATSPLGYQSAHTKTPSARVVTLHRQNLREKRERELVRRMRRGSRALIFQPGKPVALKGAQDVSDMLARETQIASNALLMPALVVQTHDRPARPVSVVELIEASHWPGQRNGQDMLLQETLEGDMVGFVPELALYDAHQLAIVERRVELLEVEEVASYVLWVRIGPLLAGCAAVDEPEHARFEKASRFCGDGGAIQPRLPAAFGDGLVRQEDAADDLIVVLHGVGKAQRQLLELLGSRHGWASLGRW
jgi:hypothetical protein